MLDRLVARCKLRKVLDRLEARCKLCKVLDRFEAQCKVLERVNWGERIPNQASVMLSCSVGPTPQLFLRPVFYSLPQP